MPNPLGLLMHRIGQTLPGHKHTSPVGTSAPQPPAPARERASQVRARIETQGTAAPVQVHSALVQDTEGIPTAASNNAHALQLSQKTAGELHGAQGGGPTADAQYLSRALEHCRDGVKVDHHALLELGEKALLQGELGKARAVFEYVAGEHSRYGLPTPLGQTTSWPSRFKTVEYLQALVGLGDVFRSAGEHRRALDCYRQIIPLCKQPDDANVWKVKGLDRIALALKGLGKSSTADQVNASANYLRHQSDLLTEHPLLSRITQPGANGRTASIRPQVQLETVARGEDYRVRVGVVLPRRPGAMGHSKTTPPRLLCSAEASLARRAGHAYAQENSYDCKPVKDHVPRLVLEKSSFTSDEQLNRVVLGLLVEKSAALGAGGRVEWTVQSPEELRQAQALGFVPGGGAPSTGRAPVRLYLPEETIRSMGHADQPNDPKPAPEVQTPFMQHVPALADRWLQQRRFNNCYFLAATRAVLESPHAPALFARCMGRTADGGVVLQPRGVPGIVVTATPAELHSSRYADYHSQQVHASQDFQLMELAFGKALADEQFGLSGIPDAEIELMGRGGSPGQVLHWLVGGTPLGFDELGENAFDTAVKTYAEHESDNPGLKKKLYSFLDGLARDGDKRLCTCGTPRHMPFHVGDKFIDAEQRFLMCHAHTLKGVDAVNRTVQVIDPYHPEAIHTLSYEEFARYFGSIHTVDISSLV